MWFWDNYKISKKISKFSQFSYDNIPEWNLNGKHFYAKILDIYDGDTITITIKIDGKYYRMNCRLHNIDTPELRSQDEKEKHAAKLARNHLIFLLTNQKVNLDISRKEIKQICFEKNPVPLINCLEFDKYGRLLISIFVGSICINEKMIEDGFAGQYSGKTKQHWEQYFKHPNYS